jgi:hypothetical protein
MLGGMSNAPQSPMSDAEQLANWFSYHPPLPGQAESYERIRAAAKAFAEVVIRECPSSADRTVAVRKVREAVYSANASIACGGR